ncbi:hypothetical protein [Kitasatospora mediocidica]|uniref:hypothetical protein n=1 Tax=Kitasatospora mediocidica TaxID=58352 RepID=UPI0005657C14|nr:hypothetical protein [Kitasatospora mediocidica]
MTARQTRRPDAYPYPSDVHHTVGALAGLLEQFPQVLHQFAAGLNAISPEHLAVLEDPPLPLDRRAEVAREFGETIAALGEAVTHLRLAQQAASRLVYIGPVAGL